MTIAATGDSSRDRTELTRWGVSLLVVLLLHGAAGLYLLSRRVPLDAGGTPPVVVVIDLAPLPAPAPPQPAPPEPVMEPQPPPQVEPTPPPPPPPEIEMPKVEPSPAPKPAVVLPPKPPPRPPKLRPVEHPPEVAPARPPPAAAAAVTTPAAPASTPRTPAPAPPAINSGAARASWQAQLVGWLERYKRYPRLAQEQRQEGTVYLRFAIDRQGRVLSSQIERGSGYALLDEEVLALIQRAQPLPAPPAEVLGARIELTVPIQFSLRSGAR